MSVFVNRILNMKKIKAIGFDMDYTLVRYKTENFERLTYGEVQKKLVEVIGYPSQLLDYKFDFNLVQQGLVIDKVRGNLLHVSRFGKVKKAQHGLTPLSFSEQNNTYANSVIDLSDENFQSLDTAFSVSNGVLYAQLVDLKEKGADLPRYDLLADHIKEAIDICHSDGSLKTEVANNISDYIIQDERLVELLEMYKECGKKLIIITNSEYYYCKNLLEYAIDPFLKKHKSWKELFEITITLSSKPRFFHFRNNYLRIDPETATMTNHEGAITPGVYQGGYAGKLQKDLGLKGSEILYLGDHIYGDVLALKKTFGWRTALVVEPLEDEINAIQKSKPIQRQINGFMKEKEELESKLDKLEMDKFLNQDFDKDEVSKIYSKIDRINNSISDELEGYRKCFNPHWGELMRAGQEESRFADQIEKYACVYVAKVSDLLEHSPRTYYRPIKRILPHELI
jgi:HAD superfamily 5'-nucleotidase-like hydrolase